MQPTLDPLFKILLAVSWISTTNGHPHKCTKKIYDPVCTSDGTTHHNGCFASNWINPGHSKFQKRVNPGGCYHALTQAMRVPFFYSFRDGSKYNAEGYVRALTKEDVITGVVVSCHLCVALMAVPTSANVPWRGGFGQGRSPR